mmetsp:Transcript_3235/g.8113  ORF Transcript_3235/g.8113 Transcript_3235/m.8113 type:complete len:288 (+) Transcript_3235:143-1006(+)
MGSPFRQSADNILGNTKSSTPGSDLKGVLKSPGTPGSRYRASFNETVKASTDPGAAPFILSTQKYGESPRSTWRRQYWTKTTPWASDRRAYAGDSLYLNNIKPSSKLFDTTKQWHMHPDERKQPDSAEDIIRTMVEKLEQHCRSTYMLTRMFKMFDRDMSSTIDRHELQAVLSSFSIELSPIQMESVMGHFRENRAPSTASQKLYDNDVIRYQDFVQAIENLSNKHPLDYQKSGRLGKERRTLAKDGQRVCTPGFRAPVGCPASGSFWPEDYSQVRSRSVPLEDRTW